MSTASVIQRARVPRAALALGLSIAIASMASAEGAPTHLQRTPGDGTGLQSFLRQAWSQNALLASLSLGSPRAIGPTGGNVVRVSSCADDGTSGTLRAAINGAADGDLIDLSQLTCSLISLEHGPLVSPVLDITLRGPGVDALTIDGNNAGRVLTATNVLISDLAIAHGAVLDDSGGGCVLANGDLSLTRAKVSGCLSVSVGSSAGGGAALVLGNLVMQDSTLAGNTVSAFSDAGGGGALVAGSATLYGSVVEGNSADASQGRSVGGGLAALGHIVLHGSSAVGNSATSTDGRAYGGGLHSEGGTAISIEDASTISGNTAHSDTATAYGGGINNGVYGPSVAATVAVEHSTISGNTVSSACASCILGGAGVHAFDSIDVRYGTVENNHALCDTASACTAIGGGLAMYGQLPLSTITLENATISGNEAYIGGGLAGRSVVASNSTIAFNHAGSGGGIAESSLGTPTAVMTSTIVANNEPDDVASLPLGTALTVGGSSNLVMTATMGVQLPADTLNDDPLLMPLDDNGGPTPTHAVADQSRAIDNGINPSSLNCDQRGFPYRRVYNGLPDIGAYEAQGERHLFADNFDGSATCF